jgi:hypothetical protein
VYDYLSDFEKHPEWIPEIHARWELVGPNQLGHCYLLPVTYCSCQRLRHVNFG